MDFLEEQKDITPIDFFESIIATRSFMIRKDDEYLSSYSSQMIDCIIKFPLCEDVFTSILSQNISNILDSFVLSYDMKDDVIIDYITELSNYATIFTVNEKYENSYDEVCKILKDVRNMNQHPLMDWTGIPILPPVDEKEFE
jgi:hypothetical protein